MLTLRTTSFRTFSCAALTAKEPTEEQLAERAAHEKVLKDVVRKVNMMTAGRPLNRY